MESANFLAVVHGVERRNLVHSHWRHLQQTCNLVHDADAGEAVLALAQVEQRHDRRLLVLRGVPLEDLGHDGLVLRGELEGYVGVVVGRVSVLLGRGGFAGSACFPLLWFFPIYLGATGPGGRGRDKCQAWHGVSRAMGFYRREHTYDHERVARPGCCDGEGADL